MIFLFLVLMLIGILAPIETYAYNYSRAGNYVLCSTNSVQYATSVSNDTYTLTNGSKVYAAKSGSTTVYEMQTFAKPLTYRATKTETLFSEPCINRKFYMNKTIPAGEYKATRRVFDLVEIELSDGSKAWVVPQYVISYSADGKYSSQYVKGQGGYMVGSKEKLSVDTLANGKPIKQGIIQQRESMRPGSLNVPMYVTIHNTGNDSAGANALMHSLYINRMTNWVSWHFSVDGTETYQQIPIDEVAWHAGDGVKLGNGHTVAIEIAHENYGQNYVAAENNAIHLTAQLLYELGLPKNAIKMHRDWNGKTCPFVIINRKYGSMGWSAFGNRVAQEYDKLVAKNGPATGPYKVWNGDSSNTPDPVPVNPTPVVTTNQVQFTTNTPGNILYLRSKPSTDSTSNKLANIPDKTKLTGEYTADKKWIKTTYNGMVGYVSVEFVTVTKQPITPNTASVNLGDVNGDGTINAQDYVLLANHILGRKALTGDFATAADVNKDGVVNAQDYVLVANHILGRKKIN